VFEIKNLTKKYGDLCVYNNFNFAFKKGQITCVLGESGCGKTTLLNVIANLTEYEGSVPKIKTSYIFQTPNLLPNLTVYGNLQLVCGDEEKIKSVINSCGLEEKINSYPNRLSGGQKQRVSIARAFLYDAELILMDEPFSFLDLKLKLSVAELFIKMQKSLNKTALFVTHDIDEALMLADRIVLIKSGEIQREFIPSKSEPPRPFGENEELRKQIIAELIK